MTPKGWIRKHYGKTITYAREKELWEIIEKAINGQYLKGYKDGVKKGMVLEKRRWERLETYTNDMLAKEFDINYNTFINRRKRMSLRRALTAPVEHKHAK